VPREYLTLRASQESADWRERAIKFDGPWSTPPPPDDYAERQGAIKAYTELIEQLRVQTASLMPPTPGWRGKVGSAMAKPGLGAGNQHDRRH
jgi:hypothetical protein